MKDWLLTYPNEQSVLIFVLVRAETFEDAKIKFIKHWEEKLPDHPVPVLGNATFE